jgi:hypothetical protein
MKQWELWSISCAENINGDISMSHLETCNFGTPTFQKADKITFPNFFSNFRSVFPIIPDALLFTIFRQEMINQSNYESDTNTNPQPLNKKNQNIVYLLSHIVSGAGGAIGYIIGSAILRKYSSRVKSDSKNPPPSSGENEQS